MRFILILVIVVFLVVFITQALPHIFQSKSSLWRTVLNKLGGAFLIIGALGFFGSVLSGIGGMNWLPGSFEWPLSGTHSALKLPSGDYAVAHTAIGRIQIYDEKMLFIKGWQIEAGGKNVYLAPSQNSSFSAFTSKGNKQYEYDFLGNLLSFSTYVDLPPVENSMLEELRFEVSPLLWPFSNPSSAWIVLVVGIVCLVVSRKPKAGEPETAQ